MEFGIYNKNKNIYYIIRKKIYKYMFTVTK